MFCLIYVSYLFRRIFTIVIFLFISRDVFTILFCNITMLLNSLHIITNNTYMSCLLSMSYIVRGKHWNEHIKHVYVCVVEKPSHADLFGHTRGQRTENQRLSGSHGLPKWKCYLRGIFLCRMLIFKLIRSNCDILYIYHISILCWFAGKAYVEQRAGQPGG